MFRFINNLLTLVSETEVVLTRIGVQTVTLSSLGLSPVEVRSQDQVALRSPAPGMALCIPYDEVTCNVGDTTPATTPNVGVTVGDVPSFAVLTACRAYSLQMDISEGELEFEDLFLFFEVRGDVKIPKYKPHTNHRRSSVRSHTLTPTIICDLSNSLCWSPLTDLGHISSVTYICHPLWFVCGHRKGILTSPLTPSSPDKVQYVIITCTVFVDSNHIITFKGRH